MKLTSYKIESIAKAIHENYRENNPNSCCDMLWENLPENIQQANRDQAGEFIGYIDLLGFTVDFAGENRDCIEQLTDAKVETAAEHIHKVWARSKEAAGWIYGAVLNDEKKLHPMLIPYADLPEAEKEKDRMIARSIIPLMSKAGVYVLTPMTGEPPAGHENVTLSH